MQSMGYLELLDSMAHSSEGWSVTIPENWMQGRTTYGGLSAALCLEACLKDYSNLPPLRSAQVNFIGPAGGKITTSSKILRQGKSTTFIEANMIGEKGLATQAVLCFGAARKSHFDLDFTSPPICPDRDDSENFFKYGPGPVFANNFECRLASGGFPISGSEAHEHYMWIRFKQDVAANASSLLAIGDMPPPAVLPMFKEFANISSMNWAVNFVQDQPSTENGWWLMRTTAEHAKQGYSSQDMQVWNSNRELVMTSRQSVAVFY